MALMTTIGMEFIARDRSRAGIASFNRSVRISSDSVSRLSRNLLALAGLGGGLYTLRNTLIGSVSEFSDFEKGMAKVATMLDAQTRSYLPEYKKEIENMAKVYGASTSDMTEGLYKILSAQIDASKAMGVLRKNVRSAKGGFASTSDTIQATVRILNAYEMSLDRVSYVQEILHKTVRLGLMDFSDLAEHIGDAIGYTAPLGVDLEALAATMSVLTRTTQSTDKAVTSLKNILNQMKNPSEEQIRIAKGLGFEMNENSIKGAGLIKIFEGLQKANAKELDILMPTIRGFAGFATALKNAGAITEDYKLMISDTNYEQDNFRISMQTTATEIDKAKESWKDFKRELGEKIAPSATNFLKNMTDILHLGPIDFLNDVSEINRRSIEQYRSLTGDVKAFTQQAGILSEPIQPREPEMWGIVQRAQWKAYEEDREKYMMPLFEGGGGGAFRGVGASGDWAMTAAEQAAEIKELNNRLEEVYGKKQNVINKKTNAEILADTRNYLAVTRSLHDKTRMEKIRMYEDYRARHAAIMVDITGAETEAGKLIRAEIEAIRMARGNSMVVYSAELREDMQNIALYTSDKFAEASRSIESSMSGAFQSMISDVASFRDAMVQFLSDIGRAFSRMAADMMARSMMQSWVQPLMSGLSGILGGGPNFQAGAPGYSPNYSTSVSNAGVDPVLRHAGWIPDSVPEYHGGRNIKSNEYLAVLEDDEVIAPGNKIVRGRSGGGSAPSIVIYNESGQQIEQKNEPEFDGESWVVSLVAKNITEGGSLSKLLNR